jgi:drug/metabolite transporter (DMT)-like permease
VLAALSGVAWAGTVLGLRWVGRAAPAPSLDATADAAAGEAPAASGDLALTTVVAGNVLACLVCLPLALPVHGATTASWLVVLYLGVVQIGVAYLALASAMPHVPALEASTLLLVEPGLNPVWAYLAHGERPSPVAWAGGALIVLSALAKTWWDARRPAGASTRSAPPPTAARRGSIQA